VESYGLCYYVIEGVLRRQGSRCSRARQHHRCLTAAPAEQKLERKRFIYEREKGEAEEAQEILEREQREAKEAAHAAAEEAAARARLRKPEILGRATDCGFVAPACRSRLVRATPGGGGDDSEAVAAQGRSQASSEPPGRYAAGATLLLWLLLLCCPYLHPTLHCCSFHLQLALLCRCSSACCCHRLPFCRGLSYTLSLRSRRRWPAVRVPSAS
jgi:hypothetical protein